MQLKNRCQMNQETIIYRIQSHNICKSFGITSLVVEQVKSCEGLINYLNGINIISERV
jgi:hypothetical protein